MHVKRVQLALLHDDQESRHRPLARHTAVSTMSSDDVPIQEISDTVGHKPTRVTETVYWHVIVLAIRDGGTAPITHGRGGCFSVSKLEPIICLAA